MDVKAILKSFWRESKLSAVILAKTLSFLLIFSKMRLGAHVLKPLRKWLESKARKPYRPNGSQLVNLEWVARFATDVFRFNTKADLEAAYPEYTDHAVREFRECRYAVMRYGKKVVVSIRGSSNEQNWVDGLTSEILSGKHRGYSTVARGIAQDLIENYLTYKDEIFITGGSMGGAVSILVGWILHNHSYKLGKIWAFANPRVSHLDYGNLPLINVFDMRDPVVYMPSFTLLARYRHQGERLAYVDGSWWLYEDSWRTDMLLSVWFMTEQIDPATHTQYGDRLLELKDAFARNAK